MARRTDIIDALRTHLLGMGTVNQVFKKYMYMDEINDFPSITFIARNEAREHRGDGRKLAVIRVDLRIYEYDRDINELDERLAEIEERINSFTAAYRQYGVEITQAVTVTGDEGLMRPYQVGDIQILITYDVDTQSQGGRLPLRVDTTTITADSILHSADATRR